MNSPEDTFSLDDLNETFDINKFTESCLKGSGQLSKLFLWCVKIQKNITVNMAEDFMNKDTSQCRKLLNRLVKCNLLYKTQMDKKMYIYHLNRDFDRYNKYIEISKKVLGLK